MNYSRRDRQNIWHPYTQMQTAAPAIPIVRGEGALLFDDKGKSYIDAISSWWLTIHGHSHPYIAEKVAAQLKVLEHVIFAGFTHPPAVELAERLLKILPVNQTKLFFSDNGSTAVEVALKMAMQSSASRGEHRPRIVALENAYHGDTFGAMAVSGRGAFVKPFERYLFDVTHIPVPVAGRERVALQALKTTLGEQDSAAFIFEPLVQGAAGMVIYQPEVLDQMLELCRQFGTITIADEVMTGFGRTGKNFAVDYLRNNPDIICLSKGLTGGTLPFAVTSCSETIYEAFLSDDPRKTFFHGHSYTANPVGCAAALASLDLFTAPECASNISRIHQRHEEQLTLFRKNSRVADARLQGTILAIELATTEQTSYFNKLRDRLYASFLERGVLLRPLGNIVYIMPPYCTTDQQLTAVYEAITEVLEDL